MTLDPTQDFEQVIGNFEKLQADYETALATKAAHENNERIKREACLQQQQIVYEEQQKRERRCALVQRFIDSLAQVIQQIELGDISELNQKLWTVEAGMDFQLRNRILRDGK